MFNSNASSAAGDANYIEDVFSTYLYTGNGSTQTITNGIDLAGEGGLTWIKDRSLGINHALFDSARGVYPVLSTDTPNGQGGIFDGVTSFNANGFSIGGSTYVNYNTANYASWTFRKQPKFFDVVTYTGNGTSTQTLNHSLGSVPGCIIIKCTNNLNDWYTYHQSLGADKYVILNGTNASATSTVLFGNTAPTSTQFTVGGAAALNASGYTYVAYIFAHNAGGFGLTGTDNVISCGSTTMGAGITTTTLGYEPQWLLIKGSNNANAWWLVDNMRGLSQTGYSRLIPNDSTAETAITSPYISITSTGFTMDGSIFGSGNTFIYIAIRRGPMKVPTSGTSVFEPLTRSGTGGATTVTTTVRPDTVLQNWRSGGLGSASHFMYDRLRGVAKALFTDTTDAESTQTATGINAFNNLSYGIAGAGSMNNGSALYADYVFTRAPSFFDEVCYTGTGAGTSQTHNLGAIPELKIIKSRSGAVDWVVGGSIISGVGGTANSIILNSTAAVSVNSTYWAAADTSTTFSVRTGNGMSDGSGSTYVAYLFASAPGVSKVGSYTGTGTTLQVNCGFTAGSRFVLIKRTDSTGDWYVWDSARGIVAGNDPYLLLNSTAAEVTSTDYVDTYSAGFELTSTAPAALNASGGTYIFLAIA